MSRQSTRCTAVIALSIAGTVALPQGAHAFVSDLSSTAVAQNVDGTLQVFYHTGDMLLSTRQMQPNGGWNAWRVLNSNCYCHVVAQNADGRLEVFIQQKQGDGHLLHGHQTSPGGDSWAWGEFPSEPPLYLTPLEAARNADGTLVVFAVLGTTTELYYSQQSAPGSDSWTPWISLGKGVYSQFPLVIGVNADGRLELFTYTGQYARHIWQVAPKGAWFAPDGVWSAWESMGGDYMPLAVGRNADGRLEVFASGTPGDLYHNVYHKWQNSSGWNESWDRLGDVEIYGRPSVSVGANSDGRLEVFVVHQENRLIGDSPANVEHIWQVAPNSSWSNWGKLGRGQFYSIMGVGRNADGRLEVFAVAVTATHSIGYAEDPSRSIDLLPCHSWWQGSDWSAWVALNP